MPYAEASTIPVHLPAREYTHYAFVSEGVTAEWQYLNNGRTYNVHSDYRAGIYGFTSIATRDSFISLCNRSGEAEVAYIASL